MFSLFSFDRPTTATAILREQDEWQMKHWTDQAQRLKHFLHHRNARATNEQIELSRCEVLPGHSLAIRLVGKAEKGNQLMLLFHDPVQVLEGDQQEGNADSQKRNREEIRVQ